ncbi:MAG TPA: hypothetical protein ENN17_04010 [bacterium]|nr:hypothetical protein [bacterium]
MKGIPFRMATCVCAIAIFAACGGVQDPAQKPRLSLFVGVDVSGSFVKGGHFDDAIDFLAHYLYAHLHGLGGLEKPNVLFVGSIGGATADEPKTFYPVQTFENKPVGAIAEKLREIFPKEALNPFTDYNAFFEQVALTVKNKNLLMRPISIVMVSDGIPDVKSEAVTDFRILNLQPIERLARSVTLRLLYTDPVTGRQWQTRVRRQRVKIWTQDAAVMRAWKDPGILIPETPFEDQQRFFEWVKDNVDFGVRAQRVTGKP